MVGDPILGMPLNISFFWQAQKFFENRYGEQCLHKDNNAKNAIYTL